MPSPSRKKTKGSILLVIMIFSAAIATAIGTFVILTKSAMTQANRGLYMNSAMNLAEGGIEEALYALNTYQRYIWSTPNNNAWLGWTTDIDADGDGATDDARRTVSNFTNINNATGEFSVVVLNYKTYSSSNPSYAIARGRATLGDGSIIEKQISIRLKRRSLWMNGLVAKDLVRFSGNNVAVDSYKSSLGNYTSSNFTNRFDNGSVASASVDIDDLNIGNADVWGRVATGREPPKLLPNGTIAAFGSAQGTVDTSRIAKDFEANLPPVSVPANPTGWPVYGGTLAALKSGNTYTLGTPGATSPTIYNFSGNINLTGSEKMKIVGPVRLIINGTLKLAGSASLEIAIDSDANSDGTDDFDQLYTLDRDTNADGVADATTRRTLKSAEKPPLQLWISDNLDLSGNGLVTEHAQSPASVQVFNTGSGTNIKIVGNGNIGATVYAPNSAIEIKGNGETFGSAVGNTVHMSGNGAFHYDESLEDLSNGRFAIDLWRELFSQADRTRYAFQ